MLIKKTTLIFLLIACIANANPVTKPITVDLTDKGFDHYLKKNYKAAAEYFEQVIAINPNNNIVRYYLTYSLIFSGSSKSALKHAKYLEQSFPNKKQYKVLVSQINKELSKQYILPQTNNNNYSKIPRETILGEYEPATNILESIAPNREKTQNSVSKPKKIKTKLEEAISYIDEDDFKNATKLLNELINENDKNSEALYQLGYVYYLQNKYEDAIPYLNKAIEISPNDFQNLYLRGNIYKGLRDYNKAEIDYKNALEIKSDVHAMQYLIDIYLSLGKYNNAESTLNELLYLYPELIDAKLELAIIKIFQGEIIEANDIIETSFNKDNQSSELKYVQALIKAESDDHNYEESISILNDILKDNPTNSKYLNLKAKCLIAQNDIKSSIDILNSVIESNPCDINARLILAEALIFSTLYDDATYELNEIEKIAKIPNTSLLLGKIAFNKENFSEADKYYDEYIKRGEGLALTYFEYAKYLASREKRDEAMYYYKRIMNEFRNTEIALKAQQEIYALNYKKEE